MAAIDPRAATVSGAVAAGVALGVGELVSGTAGTGPTLVSAVGTQFIDRFAASLKDLAVAMFGTNDKTALIVGIVIVSLLLGALFGRISVRHRWVGVAGFVAFGLVGLLSFLSDPQGTTSTGVIASILAVLAGSLALVALLRVAPRTRVPIAAGPGTGLDAGPVGRPGAGVPSTTSRRTFVMTAGVLAAGAAGVAVLGRRLGTSDVVDTARSSTVLPRARALNTVPSTVVAPDTTGAPPGTTAPAPGTTGAPMTEGTPPTDVMLTIAGLSPYVTPTANFYRIDTALSMPQIDVATWQLTFTGMVDRPFSISYDELLSLDAVEDVVTLQCVSNEVGGSLVGNAVWQGVPLSVLLDRAGVQQGATQIVGRSVDGFTAGFPTEVALDGRTVLVVYGMNGEPLRARHGFPARLVVAGLYGYVSATKWLSEIELATWEGFDGYWVPRGWSKEGPIKPQSRIDVPRSGSDLIAGTQPIAGVAWAPIEGIARVEVQVDAGEWREATLGDASSGNTWVQWWLDWDAAPGEHQIQVRATTAGGATQTEERRPPAPDGATGWHRRTVSVA
ncbi:MAG: molybdopterin-dependent oxidoreductase [Ilumatobacteraceae bacterium]